MFEIWHELRTTGVELYLFDFFLERMFYVIFYVLGFVLLYYFCGDGLHILLTWLQRLHFLSILGQVSTMLESFNWCRFLLCELIIALSFGLTLDALDTSGWN